MSGSHIARHTITLNGYLKSLNRLTLYADFADAGELARANDCLAQIDALFARVERLMSPVGSDSDVVRFNRAAAGERVVVDELTARVVMAARGVWDLTGGAFDPTVGPLVDLWGFSARTYNASHVPAAPAACDVEALRSLVGMGDIHVEQGAQGVWTLRKDALAVRLGGQAVQAQVGLGGGLVVQAQIDLGGIAKGYAVDQAARIMRDHGFAYGSYSCASSIALLRSAGELARRSGDERFNVFLTDPTSSTDDQRSFAVLKAADRFVSTSGGYGRGYSRDGAWSSHLIDPRSGRPADMGWRDAGEEVRAVTLVGPEATAGDALATALCVMGLHGAMEFYDRHLRGEWDIVLVGGAAAGMPLPVYANLAQGEVRLTNKRGFALVPWG